MVAPRSIETLYRRPTCYEIALYERSSGRMVQRLAFNARQTKRTLLDTMYRHRAAIVALEPDANDVTWIDGAWCTERHRVAFSGRTERDCACAALGSAAA